MVSKEFSKVYYQCESGWDKFWHGVEDAAETIIDVAKYICQYMP